MTDPFDLQRFLDAQAPIYARAVAELRRGQKNAGSPVCLLLSALKYRL